MLVTCMAPIGVFASDSDGTPVSTFDEFQSISEDGKYYLTNDIDFNGEQIGNYLIESFNGTLDGKGFAIKNFTVAGGSDVTGVFKSLANEENDQTVIKNLNVGTKAFPIKATMSGGASALGILAGQQPSVSNATLTFENVHVYANVNGEVASNVYFGGIIGNTANVTFKGCTMNGSIQINTTANNCTIGGVSGYTAISSKAVFESCANYASISSCSYRTLRTGGILGFTSSAVEITDCKNFGVITNTSNGSNPRITYVAGIAGDIEGATDASSFIKSCYNFGNVSGTVTAAAILGNNTKGHIDINNCVNFGKIKAGKANTLGAFILAGADTGATVTASGNQDISKYKREVSQEIEAYGVQTGAVKEDKFSVRFISLINSLNYSIVGFEVQALYNSNDVLKHKSVDVVGQTVYGSLKNGSAPNIEAPTGKYFAALSVSNVPAVCANGNVTLIFTPYARGANGLIYSDAVICVYNNGTLVSIDYIA